MGSLPCIFLSISLLCCAVSSVSAECTIPIVLRNTWFSFENGQQTITDINASEMTSKGTCVNIKADYHVNYTMVFQYTKCYYCVKLIVRTVNVLEKIETPCVDLHTDEEPTVERVCRGLNPDQNLITLFSENSVPVNCRSSLEGVWQFAYQNRYRFTEQRDTRVMMARLTVDGCQKDYVCFDFVPQHHNVIRYRKGLAMIQSNFHTVCSWVQFPNKQKWRYDIFLKKDPSPIRCPVAGKFNFTQRGDVRFETRILGGVTLSPRPNLYCKWNISDFSVCDVDQKTIQVKENYCLSVDYLGRPVDIYSDPDYRMKCIGYWKENLKSYLITYDELDPFSKYRCWVYQRADLNRVLMSQALGPYCDLQQDVTSWNYTEGAAVAIEMEEYERERDQCPMHFDDGSDPWSTKENFIKVFSFTYSLWRGNSATKIEVFIPVLLSKLTHYAMVAENRDIDFSYPASISETSASTSTIMLSVRLAHYQITAN
ncbi:jg10667 [Pararge aegeria aegeria]|uniref:Jg10667 protein n=1 Tax=Pararge aegeria aegeria TaxID=348720 RepID=A0A8S4S0R7_9NEOP|nr:jg10667 [Pararge aegeria aegeria]